MPDRQMPLGAPGSFCCAQQTGVHEIVVEALLVAIYLSEGRANTYRHKKTRANSWPLSS
jgi:hypothetical protein